MSRVTTFADLLQANEYIGRTTSNTFAPVNSVLTVTGNTGAATFVDITSTLSSAGYTPGDIIGLSTSISTALGDQYALIQALYQVTSTSFSTLTAEISSPVELASLGQFSTLSNACVSTIWRTPVATGAIFAGQTLSNQPLQFNSTIVNGWNWFPVGGAAGAISTIYASSPGIYEITSKINYTTPNSNTGLLLQLRNGAGTVLDEIITTILPRDSILTSNSISFQTIQPFSNDSVYMYISTMSTTGATIQTLSGSIGVKFLYSSNTVI
jgi:hypothetical protein